MIEVHLLTPLGLEPVIFPWSLTLLEGHLNAVPGVSTHQNQLSQSPFLPVMREEHSELLWTLYSSLPVETRSIFFGHTTNPDLFFGVVAGLGRRFPEIVEKCGGWINGENPLNNENYQALGPSLEILELEFASAMRSHLVEIRGESEVQQVLWGIGVYDYTLWNAMWLANLIREQFPGDAIIFGGDYFDEENADLLVRQFTAVDAVVVGYGEAVIVGLIQAMLEGQSVKQVTLPKLYNQAFRKATLQGKERLAHLYSPALDAVGRSPVSYLHRTAPNRIRMLTQRGCSWGECTFCSQLDRKNWNPVSIDYLCESLSGQLKEMTSGVAERLLVNADSDENDLRVINRLLAVCQDFPEQKIHFEFWLMVRKFKWDLIEALREGPNVVMRVMLNVESLNEGTIRRMRKGTNPLFGLEAMKILQDAGQVVMTNYFSLYPGETETEVTAEANLLEGSMHLFLAPRTFVSSFPYAANARDHISQHPKKYHVECARNPSDHWIDASYGMDLPFSIWAYDYHYRPSKNQDEILRAHHLMESQMENHLLRTQVARAKLAPGKVSPKEMGALLKDQHREYLELRKQLTTQKLNGFQRRKAILADITKGQLDQRQQGSTFEAPSKLMREGEFLMRTHSGTSTQEALPAQDSLGARLLNYLYFARTQREIENHFSNRGEALQLEQMLAALVDKGWVLRYRLYFLAIFHDPGALTRTHHVPRRLKSEPMERYLIPHIK